MSQLNAIPRLTAVENDEKLDAILEAVQTYDLPSSPVWHKLDEMSSHTEFEELDANPEGIFERPDGSFEVVGTAYVRLNYGGKDDQSSMSDSYPTRISGLFDEKTKTAKITEVDVDTSSFYE